MSRVRCAGLSLKGITAAVRGTCSGSIRAVPRRNFFHASDTTARGLSASTTSSSSSSGGDDGGEEEGGGGKTSVPLDQTWAEMARKQLRGADPAEKLTWRTAEVSGLFSGSSW